MLEKAFTDLCLKLAALRGSLRTVQVDAAHDEELSGELRELVAALDAVVAVAGKARNAARLPVDVDAVRRSLPGCQRQLSLLKERFHAGMGAPGRLDRYRAEGHEELAWHIGRCNAPLFAAEWAISACWSGLAEYAVLNPGGAIPGFLPPGQ